MPQSPRIVTVVTLLVVTATLLPVVGVATNGHDDTAEVNAPPDTLPRNDTTVRLHRIPNGTDPTNLPAHVGIDEPSDPVFFPGDRLVVTVQSRALAANISNASGASLTERFAATQTNESRLWVVLTNPRPQVETTVFNLSDVGNVTVVAGDAPATYHVVVDTGAVDLDYGEPWDPDTVDPDLRPGMEFYAGFDGFGGAETGGNRTIQVGTADIDVPGGYRSEVYLLQPAANATVSGDAVLPPSTPVTVELVNATTGRVVASDRATVERVDADDTTEFRFTAGLNLTGVRGDGYELSVRSNETDIGDTLPAAVHPREASLSFRNDTSQWGTSVENVTLTWGGFVVLREAGDPAVFMGASSYVYAGTEPEQAGVQFDDAIDEPTTVVAVAYRDVNGNGEFDEADEPYLRDGEPVTATAVIEPPEGTVVDTPATTATPTAPPTVVTHTTTTRTLGISDPNGTDDDGSIPGFGIGGAVAALGGLCSLVVLRRR